MMIQILAGALVVASTGFGSVQLQDGRTAWLLSAGAEVSFQADGEDVEIEARFHRGRGACAGGQGQIDVLRDGVLVGQLENTSPDGPAVWSVRAPYQDFPVMASTPQGFTVQPGAEKITIRVSDTGCGVSVTSAAR